MSDNFDNNTLDVLLGLDDFLGPLTATALFESAQVNNGEIPDDQANTLSEMAHLNTVTGKQDDVQLLHTTGMQNDETIELKLTPEPAASTVAARVEVPMRSRRTTHIRVARKDWQASPAPIEQARRPGRKPAVLDEELSEDVLKRKNRRRAQNKAAAARQRVKRNNKVQGLETEVLQLREQREQDQQVIKQLSGQHKQDQQVIMQLREQLAAANARNSTHVYITNDMNTNKPTEQEACQTHDCQPSQPDGPIQDGPMDCYL